MRSGGCPWLTQLKLQKRTVDLKCYQRSTPQTIRESWANSCLASVQRCHDCGPCGGKENDLNLEAPSVQTIRDPRKRVLLPREVDVDPEVLQSGFGVNFLCWSGEFLDIAGEFLSKFLRHFFLRIFQPYFSKVSGPKKLHAQIHAQNCWHSSPISLC